MYKLYIDKLFSVFCMLGVVLGMHDISDFAGGLFRFNMPKRGLYEVDVGLTKNFDPKGDIPLFYIDINGDKYTDIIATDSSRTRIKFYIYDPEKYIFKRNQARDKQIMEKEGVITNLVAACFGEGKPDLLITLNTGKLLLYQQEVNDLFHLIADFDFHVKAGTQPFLFDINGDFKTDFIYTNSTGERTVATCGDTPYEFDIESFENYLIKDENKEGCLSNPSPILPINHPSSSAFIDLNSDCLTDLFITSYDQSTDQTVFEIWIRMSGDMDYPTYCLKYYQTVQTDIGQVAFYDINRDGAPDLVFSHTHKDATSNYEELYILYNKIKPTMIKTWDDTTVCNKRSLEDTKEIFEIPQLTQNSSKDKVIVKISDEEILEAGEYEKKTVRIGDFNSDGYPDILVILRNTSSKSGNKKAYIYANLKCSSEICGKENDSKKLRGFSQSSREEIPVTNPLFATFFDLDENGVLDIIVVNQTLHTNQVISLDNQIQTPTLNFMSFYYNYYLDDVFFMKAQGLVDTNYGGIYFGAAFQVIITDLDGAKFVVSATQMNQNSYSPLQLPYAFFGVGRSNNFLEHLTVYYPIQNPKPKKEWSPIIPNSQLIIQAKRSGAANWKLELFVNPSRRMKYIIIIDCICIFVFILIMVLLHFREKVIMSSF